MASNEARKKAAKLFQQQHPGTPYPEALRIVSRWNDFQPLTAVISVNDKGQFVRLNFEEAGLGGLGPHCGISGETGSGKTNLLAVMAGSMRQSPPSRGVEIVVSTDKPAPLFDGVAHTAITPADLEGYLKELLVGRQEQLKQRSWTRNRGEDAESLPAVVVMLDCLHYWMGGVRPPAAVTAALQMGRSLDVHLVVTWQAPTEDTQLSPREVEPHLTGRIHLAGKPPGRGTWLQHSTSAKLVRTAITVPPAETIQRGGFGTVSGD